MKLLVVIHLRTVTLVVILVRKIRMKIITAVKTHIKDISYKKCTIWRGWNRKANVQDQPANISGKDVSVK